MTSLTLKIAQRALLAAIFVSTAAAAARAEQVTAPQLTDQNQTIAVTSVPGAAKAPVAAAKSAKIACDIYEGTPDCHDGFMPRP